MAFCDQCGERLGDQARFCPACGTPRTVSAAAGAAAASAAPPAPAPAPPERAPPAPEPASLEPEPAPVREPAPPAPPPPRDQAASGRSLPPQAELVDQLGRLGRTPAVVAAAVIGLGTFAMVFATGVVLAALPDRSLVGFLGADAGYLTEAFRQMVQLVLAGFESNALFEAFQNTSRVAPGCFALVPLIASAFFARAQLKRLQGVRLVGRLVCAAGGALVFALAMFIPALLTGDISADAGQTFGFSLLWALIGSTTGMLLAAAPTVGDQIPRTAWDVLAVLRPLGLALLVTTAIGTAAWLVNVATADATRGARSLPIALVDTTLYAVDHGVHTFELGTFAAFDGRGIEPAVLSLPLPAEEPGKILQGGSFRLLDYRRGASPVVFLLMLAVLVLIPVAAALFAGFTVAKRRALASHGLSAAWGALVGPVWAIALALLNALLQDTVHGHAQGESVFGVVLVGGALIGALGGYLAARESPAG